MDLDESDGEHPLLFSSNDEEDHRGQYAGNEDFDIEDNVYGDESDEEPDEDDEYDLVEDPHRMQ